MHPAVISPQPDTSLMVFINREYGRMIQASGKKVAGIDLETVVIRVVFIKPCECSDP